jgi:simple sugar transport system ATP-binding protein
MEIMELSNAVDVVNVSKAFGPTKALSEVSMSIKQGESRALIGKNGAGKSTLISILTGLQTPDGGSISIFGSQGRHSVEQIGCVYQRSTLIPAATAAENISLGHFPRAKSGLVNWKEIRKLAASTLDDWGCLRLLDTPVEQLEPLERKIVEICRVLSYGPKVLLLDEPTAGLDTTATNQLFERMAQARTRGVTIIYVSHYLQEIFQVCDSVSVLRDGKLVLTDSIRNQNIDSLVDSMLGDQTGLSKNRERNVTSTQQVRFGSEAPVLELSNIGVDGKISNFELKIYPGECVGLTGLDGSGHLQVAEVITGQRTPDAGTAQLAGSSLPYGNIGACKRAGIGFSPQDRHFNGYVPALSVSENVTLPILSNFINPLRFINKAKRNAYYYGLADQWNIKAWGAEQPIEELSGGNQQKVVLARSVSGDASLLVLINPTMGVDVSAKESIYTTIKSLTDQKKSVLVVSEDDSDLEICDRIIVLFNGKIVSEFQTPIDASQLALAVQGGNSENNSKLNQSER